MKTMPQLPEDYIEAVQRYANRYGRTWKSKLADHWARETLNPPSERSDAPILRSIRNSPSWNLDWLRKTKIKPERKS